MDRVSESSPALNYLAFPREERELYFFGLRAMCRNGKINDCIVSVPNEECALSKLGRTVVDRVHLEAVHMIRATRYPLKVIGEEPHDGARPFVRLQCISIVLWSVSDMPVAQRRGQKPPYVLHQEELGSQRVDEPEKLPQKRPPRLLCRTPPASCAEGLARWSPYQQVYLAGRQAETRQQLIRFEFADICFENSEGRIEPSSAPVHPNCLATRVVLFNASDNAEPSGLLEAHVEPHPPGK